MAKFCPHCAAEVEADSKFCPSCRAPLGVAAALAGELRAGTVKTFQDMKNNPSMAVPVAIWAAVWELSTTMVLAVFWLPLTVSFVIARVGLGSVGSYGAMIGASVEGALVWTQVAIVVLGLGVGAGITLSVGLLSERTWCYGLYLWAKPVLIVSGLLLMLTIPTPEGSGLLSVRMIQYLIFGLAAVLQLYLIIAMRKQAQARV
jgi:hypothetical protein